MFSRPHPVLLALFILAGCQVPPPQSPLVQTIAVLPFDSESNDINAPEAMQRLTYLALKNSVYQVADLNEVNAKLEKAGIIDGGQLPIVDPVKLGKDLGVQALLYGNVESFGYTNVGYFMQRKVTLELKLVEVATGQTFWENSGTGATRKVTLDSQQAQNNLASGLVDQLLDKLIKSPLEEEARLATLRALRTLPGFAFAGFATDDKNPTAFQKSGSVAIKGLLKK